eukprot:9488204-Pyramimonas_sp.AAC.2
MPCTEKARLLNKSLLQTQTTGIVTNPYSQHSPLHSDGTLRRARASSAELKQKRLRAYASGSQGEGSKPPKLARPAALSAEERKAFGLSTVSNVNTHPGLDDPFGGSSGGEEEQEEDWMGGRSADSRAEGSGKRARKGSLPDTGFPCEVGQGQERRDSQGRTLLEL